MNMMLHVAGPVDASTHVDRAIERLVGAVARHARKAGPGPAADMFAGRDRRRWTLAKALLAQVAQGDIEIDADLMNEIGQLYELWPSASTATYVELHDLGLGAAMGALVAHRRGHAGVMFNEVEPARI